ncbi:hypothetical protein FOXYS1_224 [Fusarium oxysporum]|uniref:Uncharacterized protein n=1 Tax=Fusarium oxysporum TaxID=5507 RepID=A0A8H5ANX5_FUSOX|nr:hypothetical protein FOXYS1_224 [Fusarium oxysporum]
MGSGPRPPRPRTLRPGQSLSQHAHTVRDMRAHGTESIADTTSRVSTDRMRRDNRKKKAKVSVTLLYDPGWLRSQTTPGLRARYKNREEDIFKLIVALHLDDHRDGIITLVVNSLADAQQIRDHSELIRDAYRFNHLP